MVGARTMSGACALGGLWCSGCNDQHRFDLGGYGQHAYGRHRGEHKYEITNRI